MTPSNICGTRSNLAVIPPMSEPERQIRDGNAAEPSLRTVYRLGDEASLHVSADAPTHFFAEDFYSLENKECNPSALAAIALPAPARSLNDDSSSTHLREIIQLLIATEVKRIYSVKVQVATTQAADEALVEMRQPAFHAANDVVKDAFFRFLENVVSEMALQRSLDSFFKRNFDRWTQYTLFMATFAQQVIS